MAMTSVDGLVSGLDTTALIGQLMTSESSTQRQLKAQASKEQQKSVAYTTINSGLAALSAAAQRLLDPNALAQTKATSSSAAVSATAAPGALAQQLSFSVDHLAKAAMHVSDPTGSRSAGGFATGPVSIGGSAPLDVGSGSLDEIVAAVNNAPALGVSAAAVQVSANSYRLQLTAKATGDAGNFNVTGIPGATPPAVLGVNAQITVANSYQVTSSTNTFANVMPGVTFSANAEASDVSINVSTDPDATANAVKGLVDAANSVLGQITSATSYNSAAKTGSPLTGDAMMRSLQQSLSDALTASGGTGSLSSLGIQLTSTGTLSFDADKFKAKLATDPAAVTQALTSGSGFAASLKATTTTYGAAHGGQIANAIANTATNIKTLNDGIADWDARLEVKQAAYKKQFSDLEVALGKLKDQSSWLSGQLARL